MQKIIVFGCGEYYKFKIKKISQKYEINAIVDNNAIENKALDMIPIYKPSYISDNPEMSIMIMTSRLTFMEIFQQLISMNIPEQRILFGINEEPYYDAAELLISKLEGKVYAENQQAVICCNRGIFGFYDEKEYVSIIRNLYAEYDPNVKFLQEMPVKPASSLFGREFGNPVDRYYIEKFLKNNSNYIQGDIAEIGDDTYTYQFGSNINSSEVLSAVDKKGITKIDLATGEGINESVVDCLICTQTLQMIFNAEAAVTNIHKLLKPGGVALITSHGISKISMLDYLSWGEYWHFTPKSFTELLARNFGAENIEIASYGNVKTACAFLYGLCCEYLSDEDFSADDFQFPVIISAVCHKD